MNNGVIIAALGALLLLPKLSQSSSNSSVFSGDSNSNLPAMTSKDGKIYTIQKDEVRADAEAVAAVAVTQLINNTAASNNITSAAAQGVVKQKASDFIQGQFPGELSEQGYRLQYPTLSNHTFYNQFYDYQLAYERNFLRSLGLGN